MLLQKHENSISVQRYQDLLECAAGNGRLSILKFLVKQNSKYQIAPACNKIMRAAALGGHYRVMIFVWRTWIGVIDDMSAQHVGFGGCPRAVWLVLIWLAQIRIDASEHRWRHICVWRVILGLARGGHKHLVKAIRDNYDKKCSKHPLLNAVNVRTFVMRAAASGSVGMLRAAREWVLRDLPDEGKNVPEWVLEGATDGGVVRCIRVAVRWGARDFTEAIYSVLDNELNEGAKVATLRTLRRMSEKYRVPLSRGNIITNTHLAIKSCQFELIVELYKWVCLSLSQKDHERLMDAAMKTKNAFCVKIVLDLCFKHLDIPQLNNVFS